jgi:hypothetical protein
MKVAVKLVKAGMDSDEILRRFRTERQVLARLQHPFIARLLDGGATDRGRPYLVMEHVEGTSIQAYCDQHRLSLTQRLDLFRKVCGAVQYAHRNLVVHRDLKPGNILVTAGGDPKLLDFGIASVLGPGSEEDAGGRTGAGQRPLTPRYASPEQIRGEPVTTASDVYSLGVILYELLTGQEPYALTTGSRAEYEHAICDLEPARPSTARAGTAGNDALVAPGGDSGGGDSAPAGPGAAGGGDRERLRRLRGDLDAILLKALRKEPEARYASPDELSQDLERHLRGLPVAARRGTWSYRATKFLRRHAAGAAVVVALLAVLVGGAVATARQARIAAGERNVAIAARERAQRAAREASLQARRAEHVTRFLQRVLTSANPRRSRRGLSAEEALAEAAARVREEFGADPEVEAAVHDAIGQTYLDLGRHAEAQRHLRAAFAIQMRIHPGDSPTLAASLRNLGKYTTPGRSSTPHGRPPSGHW